MAKLEGPNPPNSRWLPNCVGVALILAGAPILAIVAVFWLL